MKRASDGADLLARLEQVPLGIGVGESRVTVRDRDQLIDPSRDNPRDDGAVADSNGVVREDIAETEELYGPTWRAEVERRENVLENDPQYRFVQLLAGAMATDVHMMYTPKSVENETRYRKELEAIVAKERERLMVPAATKRAQIAELLADKRVVEGELGKLITLENNSALLANLSADVITMTGTAEDAPRGLPLVLYEREQLRLVLYDLALAHLGANKVQAALRDSSPLRERIKQWFFGDTERAVFRNVKADAYRRSVLPILNEGLMDSVVSLQFWSAALGVYLVLRNDIAAAYTNMPRIDVKTGKRTLRPTGDLSLSDIGLHALGTIQSVLRTARVLQTNHTVLWLPPAVPPDLSVLRGSFAAQPVGGARSRILSDDADVTPLQEWILTIDANFDGGTVVRDDHDFAPIDWPKGVEAPSTHTMDWQAEEGLVAMLVRANDRRKQDQPRMGRFLDANALASLTMAVVSAARGFLAFYDTAAYDGAVGNNQKTCRDVLIAFYDDLVDQFVSPTMDKHVILQNVSPANPAVTANTFLRLVYSTDDRRDLDFSLGGDNVLVAEMKNVQLAPGGLSYDITVALPSFPNAEFLRLDASPKPRRILLSWLLSLIPDSLLYDTLFTKFLVPTAQEAFNPPLTLARAYRAITIAIDAWFSDLTTMDTRKREEPFAYKPATSLQLVRTVATASTILLGEYAAYGRAFLRGEAGLSPQTNEAFLYGALVKAIRDNSLVDFYRPGNDAQWSWFRTLDGTRSDVIIDMNALERVEPLRFASAPPKYAALTDLSRREDAWLEQAAIPRTIVDLLPAPLRYALDLMVLSSTLGTTEADALRKRIATLEDVIESARAEYERIVHGLQKPFSDARRLAERMYRPPVAWQMRAENTGYLRLNAEVVLRMEEALALVHQYVPALADITLDELTRTIDIATGLPGAFARLVAALVTQGRLSHPHTYMTSMQHEDAPARRAQALHDLRAFVYNRAMGTVERRAVDGRTMSALATPTPRMPAGFYIL